MSVKEHYDNHLAAFYSWMAGDLDAKVIEFLGLLEQSSIKPQTTRMAIDLGPGHGIQALGLARAGYKVLAIDFNKELLQELARNAEGHDVQAIEDDIRNISQYAHYKPELVSCCGDTITHLDNKEEVDLLLSNIAGMLEENGKLILNFRDYTNQLYDILRFIPVRSSDERIFTCFLEYFDDHVKVTDLVYEKEMGEFELKASSYRKVRLGLQDVLSVLEREKFSILYHTTNKGMINIIAKKL